jgi:hypothetical protein
MASTEDRLPMGTERQLRALRRDEAVSGPIAICHGCALDIAGNLHVVHTRCVCEGRLLRHTQHHCQDILARRSGDVDKLSNLASNMCRKGIKRPPESLCYDSSDAPPTYEPQRLLKVRQSADCGRWMSLRLEPKSPEVCLATLIKT